MTNYQKFTTPTKRAEAFALFCVNCKFRKDCLNQKRGGGWKNVYVNSILCFSKWLDLEAEEEKPLPCPFCGNDKLTIEKDDFGSQVHCLYCGYRAIKCGVKVDPIAAHNRVAKAVRESEGK